MIEMAGDDSKYLRGPKPRARAERGSLRAVDLFCGCGGLMLGIAEAARQHGRQLDVRLAAELDPATARAYASNFNVQDEAIARDVTTLFNRRTGSAMSFEERRAQRFAGPDVDLLVGGPPCQGHSTLNNHTRGDDPKNELYLTMVRAAEVLHPRALLIENVPAVERDRRRALDRVVDRLSSLGYRVDAKIICVADIGVPQLRRRHVLVAHESVTPRLDLALEVAEVGTPRSLRWAIKDLQENDTLFDSAAALTPANQRRAAYLLKHDRYDLPNRMRPPCQHGPHKYKSMYGRLRWDAPAQTITSGFGSPGQGRYLHPMWPRTITPHEAARIQFFPDWFDFSGFDRRKLLARVIGNAVPPKLAFVVAHHLLSIGASGARAAAEHVHALVGANSGG